MFDEFNSTTDDIGNFVYIYAIKYTVFRKKHPPLFPYITLRKSISNLNENFRRNSNSDRLTVMIVYL